jgi:hypothetical protein
MDIPSMQPGIETDIGLELLANPSVPPLFECMKTAFVPHQ